MQALVLVGGMGTRLRPLTYAVPKPVLPLVDRPFLAYMLEWLGRHGVTEVLLASGFAAGKLKDQLGDAAPDSLSIRFVEEPEPLGTAGGVKYAEALLGERFLVLNGDILTDLDLTDLLAAHEETGARATLGLYPVADPSAYGLVRRKPEGEVLEFLEKPEPEQIDTDEISAGMYVLEREVLELIPAGRESSIEREVFPRLVGRGLYGRRLEGYWADIGKPDTYLRASWDILEGNVETDVRDRLDGEGVLREGEAELAADAEVIAPAAILAGASVGAGAVVGPRAVVGAGSEIGPGARIENSVLHSKCVIGEGAVLRDSILGAGVEVQPGAALSGEVLAVGGTE